VKVAVRTCVDEPWAGTVLVIVGAAVFGVFGAPKAAVIGLPISSATTALTATVAASVPKAPRTPFTVTNRSPLDINISCSIEEGATDGSQRVVVCSPTGVVEFASASSRELLKRYLGLDNGRVPTAVLARRELTLRDGDRSLRIRTARTDNLHLLMIEERWKSHSPDSHFSTYQQMFAILSRHDEEAIGKHLGARNLQGDPYRRLALSTSAHASEHSILKLFWWLWIALAILAFGVHLLWHLINGFTWAM